LRTEDFVQGFVSALADDMARKFLARSILTLFCLAGVVLFAHTFGWLAVWHFFVVIGVVGAAIGTYFALIWALDNA
jgi:hypothetical protein